MATTVTPMVHVPDVQATVDWYKRLGFSEVEVFGNGHGGLSFAIVSLGQSLVMFNQGGATSDVHRREVDLYINTPDVEQRFASLPPDVEVFEPLHDTDYGMREFIIRDLNRFWITFGRDL